jgi:hypothetical protein
MANDCVEILELNFLEFERHFGVLLKIASVYEDCFLHLCEMLNLLLEVPDSCHSQGAGPLYVISYSDTEMWKISCHPGLSAVE